MAAVRPPVVTFSIPEKGLPCGCVPGATCGEHARILALQAGYEKAEPSSVADALTWTSRQITEMARELAQLRAERQRQVIAARWAQVLTAEEIAHRSGLSSQTTVAKLCAWARRGFPPKAQAKGVR